MSCGTLIRRREHLRPDPLVAVLHKAHVSTKMNRKILTLLSLEFGITFTFNLTANILWVKAHRLLNRLERRLFLQDLLASLAHC